MKNNWIAFLLFFCIALMGCKEEPLPLKKVVTIEAIASQGGVIEPKGITEIILSDPNQVYTKTYKFIADKDYQILSVEVDGVKQPISESYTFQLKFSDVYSHFSKIKVDFIHNDVLLITKAPWFLNSLETRLDDEIESYLILNEEQKSDIIYFRLDGTTSTFHKGETKAFGNYYWVYLDNRFIKIGTETSRVDSLTEFFFRISNLSLLSRMEKSDTATTPIGGPNYKNPRSLDFM